MGPREWFKLLFGDCPAGWLTISTKRDAASRATSADPFLTSWFEVSDLDQAGAFAMRAAEEANVYFGLGLRRQRIGGNQRGCADDVCAIPGLWLEVDVAGGTHDGSAKTYFPSKDAALEFLMQGLPLPPSVVVDSGGGLHAHWLFREPLLIEEGTDLELAAGLVRGWQSYVRSRTSSEIDSTHDLARVLRPPGTWNRKNGTTREVVVTVQTDRRYSPDDFSDWIEVGERAALPVPTGLTARPGAEPPGLKFIALRDNDKRFRDHWDERPINPKDNSASAHCLGLATIAVKAGWSDQEIVDLLVAFTAKAKHANAKNARRSVGWYAVTIARARHGNEAEADQALAIRRVATATEPEERLAALSALLGFQVDRVIRRFHVDQRTRLTMDPWYVIETPNQRVDIPSSEIVMSRPRFQALILGHLNVLVRIRSADWPMFVEAFAAAAVTEDAPPEVHPCEEVRRAVVEYLERRGTTDDPLTAYDSNLVLERDGARWFSASRWAEWARMKKGLPVANRNVARLLTMAGCRRLELHNIPRRNSRVTNLTFWASAENSTTASIGSGELP